MKKDDYQISRILSRRKALALFRAIGTAILVVGCTPKNSRSTQVQSSVAVLVSSLANSTSSACVVTPEQTEGPYFVDEKLNRSDIRSDPADGSVKDGVPFKLTLRVSQIDKTGCAPLAGAIVDIWHCDALGVYSDVTDSGFNTVGKKFLRGYQVTDANGSVEFTTIYPGWYQGRTVHIHFKVRTDGSSAQSYEFTSQLYFDDSITDRVHTQKLYASKGQRNLKNAGDIIFQDGGEQMLLKLTKTSLGYAATFDIGLQMV
ncbi:MAG: intradiol ring-cleavage dioxygenase [Nostoc sp. DedVER02]|uniref:intradiol ring-cleavage dioxygenase n=1 Tax=unclassified Nostoc TaxID=2593658 RepID=UPI002AD45127|nr:MULTISPECIES: intradiol ring-cleavage dioxygenase [unclassified Nostoc]MDZ7989496.1 intradiol ring-cleavage dioxygenase [Nostoc sp. DedVER02]MDZ8114593.1 intradiol ring-cleavage dioxygenase [Nostoc sp. DedVER01b]